MEEKLTSDQQVIFDIIENTDKNILVHGKPGVGKTVLTRALYNYGMKSYTLGAPTGLAAINMGGNGKTLHSLFMIPVTDGFIPLDYKKFTNNPNVLNNIKYTIKHLIIDEISMVRSDILDYIDRVLRFAKDNELPFGGIQVIAVGDFFQLPPVVHGKDKKGMLAAGWKSEFAFDALAFKSFTPLILDEVLRQKGDDKFISILHSARTGFVTPKDLVLLNKRVSKCTDFRIRLCGNNKQADAVNQTHLASIKEPLKEFHANNFGSWPAFPAETILMLKVGAQVLIKKNNADRPAQKFGMTIGKSSGRIVNGTLGIIREMPETVEGESPRVLVELRDGSTVYIYIARWERKERKKVGDEYVETVIAAFEQFPFQLAWAISMHKSQGQSFEFVHVDPSSVFAAGQLYVALSRARSLAGLSLQSKVNAEMFWASKTVLKFVKQIENESKEAKEIYRMLQQV